MVFLICVVVCVVFPFSPPCSDVGAYVVLGMLFACVSFKQGLLVCLLKKVQSLPLLPAIKTIFKKKTSFEFSSSIILQCVCQILYPMLCALFQAIFIYSFLTFGQLKNLGDIFKEYGGFGI